MNCQLCKYRTQIIGYETDAGAPQEAITTTSAASAPTAIIIMTMTRS